MPKVSSLLNPVETFSHVYVGKKWKKITREGNDEALVMYGPILAKRNYEEISGVKLSKKRRAGSDNDKSKINIMAEAVK